MNITHNPETSRGATEIVADADYAPVTILVEDSISPDGGDDLFLNFEKGDNEVSVWLSVEEADALVAAIELARSVAKENRA